jgi:iron complex outermembrane receptor protein
LSFLNATGRSENYRAPSSFRRLSALAGNRFSFLAGRLAVLASTRAEYFSAGTLPMTANLGVEYNPRTWLKAGLSWNTAYRQPTLNEVYWRPGGNLELKPERSGSAEGHVTAHAATKEWRYGFTLAAYTRTVTDWIIWTPGVMGQPTPMNIQEVWSRGAETTWWTDHASGEWSAGTRVATSYALSTVVRSYSQNNASVGKQLIYTPRYMANGNMYAGFRSARVYALAQYAGYRFTTSDNSAWLPPYLILSVRGTQEFSGAGLRFTAFAACNNVLDERYTIIDGRWMPLRHFEFGITIHFDKYKPNEKKQNNRD